VLERRWLRHLAWVGVAVVASAIFAYGATRGETDPWVEVGTLTSLRSQGAVYLEGSGVFVVDDPAYPVAVHEEVPHLEGDRALWCPTARVFVEIEHGSLFDRTGAYLGGPAVKGLDAAPVRVEGERVLVRPDERIPGPARHARAVVEPAGLLCTAGEGGVVEGPPGFVRTAPG
jgi:nitrite reductase/ring-hydroxylating ferredoxin subunit